MSKTYTQEIPIAWHHIRDARKLVQDALSEHEDGLRDAVGMTMSELLENAMKYGESVAGMSGASFTLTVTDDEIRIEVKNGIAAPEPLALLRSSIDAIAKAPDKEALYVERLQEILEHPSAGGRLGLFRVAYEGGFDLSCRHDDPIVTVMARRRLR